MFTNYTKCLLEAKVYVQDYVKKVFEHHVAQFNEILRVHKHDIHSLEGNIKGIQSKNDKMNDRLNRLEKYLNIEYVESAIEMNKTAAHYKKLTKSK